jgi:hypothetical protein
MEQVEVRTTPDGMIEIVQHCGAEQPADVFVRLHPDQIGTLTSWLAEARTELQTEGADEAGRLAAKG